MFVSLNQQFNSCFFLNSESFRDSYKIESSIKLRLLYMYLCFFPAAYSGVLVSIRFFEMALFGGMGGRERERERELMAKQEVIKVVHRI